MSTNKAGVATASVSIGSIAGSVKNTINSIHKTEDEIYFVYGSKKKKLKIPVLPESYKVTDNSGNTSATVADLGEITILQGRKAKTVSFSSIFPIYTFSGASLLKPKAPIEYVKKFEKFINNNSIITFVLARKDSKYPGFSMNVTVEKFDWTEEGEDSGTIQYNITIKEYRAVTVNKIKPKKGSNKNSSKVSSSKNKKRASTKSNGKKAYTIKKHDTLWAIAKKYLGKGSRYTEIYNLNKSVIEKAAKKHGKKSSSKGHWIYPGTVIMIPKK